MPVLTVSAVGILFYKDVHASFSLDTTVHCPTILLFTLTNLILARCPKKWGACSCL